MNSSPAPLSSLRWISRSALRSPWAWCGLALAIGAGLLNAVPPFRDIHYEFSAASALALSLLPCGIIALRRQRPERVSLERDATLALLLAAIPLLVALLILPFRSDVCLGDGPRWYLLLVPPSALISLALGRLAETIVPKRRWLRVLLVLLLWTGSLGRGLWEALTGPHIFLYCWQIGYFPGGTWESFIPVPDRLVFYRAVHLLVAGGLLTVTELWERRDRASTVQPRLKPLVIGVIALGTIIPLLLGLRVRLGLASSDAWVEEQLGDTIRTRWSVIVTNRAAVDSLALGSILLEIDHDVEEYAQLLHTRPETFAPVRIVLYPNGAERQRLVGSQWVAYTKPWRGEMHIVATEWTVLRHELAHLAMAPFGNILGFNLSQGLLEGSAEGISGGKNLGSLEHYVASMQKYRTNRTPSPGELMEIGSFTGYNTSAAYAMSGAFCRWLIDTFGPERFTRLYATGDFEEAYNLPLATLSKRYGDHLDSVIQDPRFTLDLLPEKTVSYLYGGGGFFQQRCLRALGAANAAADAALSANRPELALELSRRALEFGGSASTRTTIIRALAALGRYGAVRDSIDHYVESSWALPLHIELGDAEWRLGNTKRAAALYNEVGYLRLSSSLTIRALARWTSLNSSDPKLGESMLHYFTSTMSPARRVAWLTDQAARTSDTSTAVILRLLRAQLLVNEAPVSTIQQLYEDGTLRRAQDIAFTQPVSQERTLVRYLLTELAPAAILRDRARPDTPSAWDMIAPYLLHTPMTDNLTRLAH